MSTNLIETTDRDQSQALATVQIGIGRVAQEVQAAVIVAKKFPRDETAAVARIVASCQRYHLALAATYSYQRGGTMVEGASIRMAEVLARSWGNMDFGVVEIEQRLGESTMMAYAWDLEHNVREARTFVVPHVRESKNGRTQLNGPRDIYEVTANMAARRLRACILAIIPTDVQERALIECRKTREKGDGTPLADRIREMAIKFAEVGVSQEMLERRLGHALKLTNAKEISDLIPIYHAINDGVAKREEWFQLDAPVTPNVADIIQGATVEGNTPREKPAAKK